MDLKGRLGAFNVKDGSWNVIPCKDKSIKIWKLHLVELKGEIFEAKRGRRGIAQEFFKLKVRDDLSEWEKEEVAVDVTYCLGDCRSMAMPEQNPREGEKMKLTVASHEPKLDGTCCSKSIRENDLFGSAYHRVWI
ncbi:hypothetical protein NL676_002571 [Syzygium grande]|nr:hypothetical protein NL676_002571 [Syzygium grande]